MTEDEKVIEHLRSCDKHPERASMYTFDNAIECIKQLRKERDEARQEIKLLRKERDAALAVVDEFIIDTTTNNETPIHECAFLYDPEKGKCNACEAWGNYVGLFCSSEEEETQ